MPLLPSLDDLAARLRGHVERLATVPRPPESGAHEQTQVYVAEQLRQAGFTVRESVESRSGMVCRNLLTEPEPREPRLPLFVIGAHYDSIPGSPGADDNASAVAALIELARWLGPQLQSAGTWRASLQLAAYDLEEYGFIGSLLHSEAIARSRRPLMGMISLEMLGYVDNWPGSQKLPRHLAHLYPNVGNFIGVVGTDGSMDLLRVVVEGMKKVAGLPVECLAVPGDGRAVPETRLSDHSSFWDHGYPALMITDTSFFRNPHYHQSTDTPETLNYPFLAKVTAGVCEAVHDLVTSQPTS
jgi:Zn-dependent M28 family amino/carboxypeptidase